MHVDGWVLRGVQSFSRQIAALPAFHTEGNDGDGSQALKAQKAHKASCLRGAPLEAALADVHDDAKHLARQLLRSLDDLTDQLKVGSALPQSNRKAHRSSVDRIDRLPLWMCTMMRRTSPANCCVHWTTFLVNFRWVPLCLDRIERQTGVLTNRLDRLPLRLGKLTSRTILASLAHLNVSLAPVLPAWYLSTIRMKRIRKA